MILWSVVPIETIYDTESEGSSASSKYEEVHFGQVTMIVEPTGILQGKIVRLISPEAKDYLKPEWMPGKMIRYPEQSFEG